MAGVVQVADPGAAIRLKVRLPRARTHTSASLRPVDPSEVKGQVSDQNSCLDAMAPNQQRAAGARYCPNSSMLFRVFILFLIHLLIREHQIIGQGQISRGVTLNNAGAEREFIGQ